MRQMMEQGIETDIRVGLATLASTIARYTCQPPGSTDPDFPQWWSFAPALFDQRNLLRIIFAVASRQFGSRQKHGGTAEENCQYQEANRLVSRPIVHGALAALLSNP